MRDSVMLAEPDLFTSVGSVQDTTEKTSQPRYLHYTWHNGIKDGDDKDGDDKDSDDKDGDDKHASPDKIARKWYLTIIVLLYVGLIASFCLNISLLIKTFPQHSPAEINLPSQHLALEYPPPHQG